MRRVSVVLILVTFVICTSAFAQKEDIDISALTAGVLLPVPHTPCAAGPMSCGQTKSGRVSVDSCNVQNIYGVGYSFTGTQGQVVTLTGTSFEFAASIFISDGNGVTLARDDKFLVGETARISNFTLPYTGGYILLITPLVTTTFGDYTMTLTCGSTTPPIGSCTENSTTACMLNSRFRVTVRFRDNFDNNTANVNALKKSVTGFSNPAYETAFFYFNDPNNIEMMVKLLDQGNTNSAGQRTIAVLFGSATPLRIEVNITDMQTGATKTYHSFFNEMKGTTDFTAFVR